MLISGGMVKLNLLIENGLWHTRTHSCCRKAANFLAATSNMDSLCVYLEKALAQIFQQETSMLQSIKLGALLPSAVRRFYFESGCRAAGDTEGEAQERRTRESCRDAANPDLWHDDGETRGSSFRPGEEGPLPGSCRQVERDERRAAERHPEGEERTAAPDSGTIFILLLIFKPMFNLNFFPPLLLPWLETA